VTITHVVAGAAAGAGSGGQLGIGGQAAGTSVPAPWVALVPSAPLPEASGQATGLHCTVAPLGAPDTTVVPAAAPAVTIHGPGHPTGTQPSGAAVAPSVAVLGHGTGGHATVAPVGAMEGPAAATGQGIGAQGSVAPLGTPGAALSASGQGIGAQAAPSQPGAQSVAVPIFRALPWRLASCLWWWWWRRSDFGCLVATANGVADCMPPAPVVLAEQMIAGAEALGASVSPDALASAGIAIAIIPITAAPTIRSCRYTRVSLPAPAGAEAQAASRSPCVSMSNGGSADPTAKGARSICACAASLATANRASASRTRASDQANATAIGAISSPAISATVVWLLLVAQSHAPQSSAASAAVTPSGPSGIADRVPPPADNPS
jgi:hypothetical protein